MKRFIYIITLLLCTNTVLLAQSAGQRFIQGGVMLNFDNNDYKEALEGLSTNNYGYSFNIQLGKFKKDNLATGWLIGSSLSGGKSIYVIYNNVESSTTERSGIKGVGASIGRFWHFYKPFNDKLGIYGGPDVRLSYNYSNVYGTNNSGDEQYVTQSKGNAVSVSLGLSGSIYYALSERWWLEASLAYANPFFLSYSKETSGRENDLNLNTTNFQYHLSPQLTLPSVGIGLRYFLK